MITLRIIFGVATLVLLFIAVYQKYIKDKQK